MSRKGYIERCEDGAAKAKVRSVDASRFLRTALLRLVSKPAVTRTGHAAQRWLAKHTNHHLVQGMADPSMRPDVGQLIDASSWSVTPDYVRDATLSLLCREVREGEVPGAVGELGVFRGDFAVLLSSYLPDRPLHLFDTFAGFAEQDVEIDVRDDLVPDVFDFSATTPEAVRARFPRPDQVHLHVGYFPDTTKELDEDLRFALVSIDADLYAPVLSGLDWFFDRLSPGGYILVHDYNNAMFGGAKKAVQEFQSRTKAALVPLPDWGGTAVFARPHE